MTRRSQAVSPDQESLFVMSPETGQIYPDLQALPMASPEAGLIERDMAVDVMERAVRLQEALLLFGKMSQRTGFAMAAQENRYRPAFRKQYGDQLDDVVAGTANTRNRMEDKAYNEFSHAFGKTALVTSGMADQETAEKITYDAFGQFKQSFADSRNREQRDKFRKQLIKNEKRRFKSSKNNAQLQRPA